MATMRDLMEMVQRNIRLDDLYTQTELHDETEELGRLASEFGNISWNAACAFPLPVKEIAAKQAAATWTSRGRRILTAFRNATKQQRQIVGAKQNVVDVDRIVVVDGTDILDGNHHVVASIRAGSPIKYIDLADLPENL